MRKSYLQTLGASYFVKLIERVAEAETPIPELDDLLNRALDYLDENPLDLRAVRHFEKQLVGLLGIADGEHPPDYLLQDHFGLPKQRDEILSRLEKKKRMPTTATSE